MTTRSTHITRRLVSQAHTQTLLAPSATTSRRSSTSFVSDVQKPRKVVLVGAGFLGSYIAKALVADPRNRVVLVSRNPQPLYDRLRPLGSQILPPVKADITNPTTLSAAMEGADAVVSLVGILVGSAAMMEKIQLRGAENVARAAKNARVGRLVLMSAIGADVNGITPYWRTKGLAEESFLKIDPTSTIIRPSIIFGPGDSFFNRFATLAKWLPFLPVFGGGSIRFQPVYAGDIARAVEICCRSDPDTLRFTAGKVIEAGGPDIFTYREIMQLVLKYSGLEGRRMIISLPYWLGMAQAWFLEKLPESIFTLTREQVKQLKVDNIVSPTPPLHHTNFSDLLSAFPPSLPTSTAPEQSNNDTSGDIGRAKLTGVESILPLYLSPKGGVQNGKRTHGRGKANDLPPPRVRS